MSTAAIQPYDPYDVSALEDAGHPDAARGTRGTAPLMEEIENTPAKM